MSESLGSQLCEAADRGKAAEVTRLLAAGAEVNWGHPYYLMNTPLHAAAAWDRSDCVRVLLAHPGCDVDARDEERHTPLMWAAECNHLEVAALLLEAGADTQAVDEGGKTALDRAESRAEGAEMRQLLTDPAILRWGNSLMSDEALQTRLQSLPSDMRYRVLLLQGYHLTRVPDLTKFPQFSQLQVLNMADNKLTEVKEEHLPASVRTLHLSRNKIHTMSPQLVSDWLHSYFHMMCNSRQSDNRQVILDTCPIVADVQQKIEEGVYDIYGTFHETPRVDRLPDLSHSETVREVLLPYRHISFIDVSHFPALVENINLNYNVMQSLPYIKHMKSLRKISLSNNKIVVVFGLPSWLQSIDLEGNPIRTLHRDCFPSEEVYNLVSEALTRRQIDDLQQPPPQIFRRGYKAVIQYYDQAAMSDLTDSYSNRLAVVGEASAGKTSLVQTLIHRVPCLTGVEDRTEVVQTHTWRLPDGCTYQVFDQGGQKIYAITNRFFLSKDSKNLICHNIKEGSIDTATEMLKNILHQFPNGHIHFGLTKLDLINDEVDQKEKIDDFKEKISNTFERQIALLKSQTKAKLDVNLITSYENRKKTVRFFPVSSQNVKSTSEIASFFHEIAKENKQVVPQHWLDCLESVQKNKEPFLSLSEFKKYYDKHNPKTSKLTYIKRLLKRKNQDPDTSSTSLRYFSDCGLVIWYEDHPTLKGFVFHNIQYLISLMKCVFRHDLVKHLSYDKNADLKEVFRGKANYKKHIEEFQTQGLLSLKLLTYLWKDEFGAEVENKDKFLELMKCLDICQEVWAKNSEKKYFFPWFVTDEEEPLVVKEMCKTDNSHIMLNLECIFTPDIPNNVTELMIVHLQRLASEKHYLGDRKAWRDGFYISDSDLEASVLREPKTHSLQIYVKNKVGEIFTTWKDFLQLKDSLSQILSQWCGIEESIHIPCFHCTYIKKSEPKLWPLEDVFGTGREKVYTSCSGDKEVPAALVTMINTDDKAKQEEHIKAVKEFLEPNAQAETEPVKPLQEVLDPHPVVTQEKPEMDIKVKHMDTNVVKRLLADKKDIYPVKSANRGRAVIINNHFLDTQHKRVGTEYDENNLEKLFQQLHFTPVIHDNLSRQAILDVLEEERSNKDHNTADAFILCILSHGEKGNVHGNDGQKVNIEDEICAKFDGKRCKALIGKPKIFIIQACQGDVKTTGVPVPDAAVCTPSTPAAEPSFIHEKADMLIAYSTVTGYLSWRDRTLGSWFVRAIVEIFAEKACTDHVADLLTKVKSRVGEKHKKWEYLQIPKTESTLTKHFYFFPGYKPGQP